MAQARHGAVAAALGGRIYVCGGLEGVKPLNSVERFDEEMRDWMPMPQMVRARGWPTCAVVEESVYICGGRCEEGAISAVERFEPELEWSLLWPMPTPRYGALGVVVSGHILVIGGRAGQSEFNHVEAYDYERDRWEWKMGMRHSRSWAVGAVLPSVTEGRRWRRLALGHSG